MTNKAPKLTVKSGRAQHGSIVYRLSVGILFHFPLRMSHVLFLLNVSPLILHKNQSGEIKDGKRHAESPARTGNQLF